MSLRWLLPHTQRRATTLGLKTVHTHSSLQIHQSLHRRAGLRLGLRKNDMTHRLARSYSNYAPRGPAPYYHNMHNQPPSRASRLKHMALGSVLTILIYSAYQLNDFLAAWKEVQAEQKVAETMDRIFDGGMQMLMEAEADDDGSAESAQRIRDTFIWLIKSILLGTKEVMKDERQLMELGPLSKFPEAHKFHGTETIEDQDTSVFMLVYTTEEMDLLHEDLAEDEMPDQRVIVGVYAHVRDLDVGSYQEDGSRLSQSGFDEILRRMGYMVQNLYQNGTLYPKYPTVITLILRDKTLFYVHDGENLYHRELVQS